MGEAIISKLKEENTSLIQVNKELLRSDKEKVEKHEVEKTTLFHEIQELSISVKEQEEKLNTLRQINIDDNAKLIECKNLLNQITGENIAKGQIITNHVNDTREKAEQIHCLKLELAKINKVKTNLGHDNLKLSRLLKEKEEEMNILSKNEEERYKKLNESEKVQFETILKEKIEINKELTRRVQEKEEMLNNLRKKNIDNNGKLTENFKLIRQMTGEKATLSQEKEKLCNAVKEQEEELNKLRLKSKEDNGKLNENKDLIEKITKEKIKIEAIMKEKEVLNTSLETEMKNHRLK